MKIGIDIRSACGTKTGKGWYAYRIVRELLKLDHRNEYLLYANKVTSDVAEMVAAGGHIKLIPKGPLTWHFAVARDFVREQGDVFFAPSSYLVPAFLPKKVASVVMIQDLVAFLWSRGHQIKATILERLFLPHALKKAKRVLVPSANTQRDIEKMFPKASGKIILTPLAAGEEFFEPTSSTEQARVETAHALPKRFILTVGTLEPRKNLELLLDVFAELPEKFRGVSLVVVGGKGWKADKLHKKIERLGKRVRWIEGCSAQDLPVVYKLATIFVFPSLYEGFGFPPLEAMASGCPVICSNAGSLPEVIGDAALIFDPHDKKTLRQHLGKMLEDSALRKNLAARGHEQAAKFSWEKTARDTWKILQNSYRVSPDHNV